MHHERSERHVRADRAYPLDDHRERRGRVLLLGKGAVLTQRVAGPLAAELDDQRQRSDAPNDAVSALSLRGTRESPLSRGESAPCRAERLRTVNRPA